MLTSARTSVCVGHGPRRGLLGGAPGILTAALLTVLIGAARTPAARTQIPPPTAAEFQKSMVAIGEALGLVESLVDSPAYLLNSARGDVITRVAIMRRQMGTVRMFFDARGVRDGVGFANDLLGALGSLEYEVTVAEPDQAAALEALGGVRDACDVCHRAYREGDRQTGYRLTPGAGLLGSPGTFVNQGHGDIHEREK
jgi:hypothetical protein